MSFGLDGEAYGIDILGIQEITRYEMPTRVPNMPEYMEGVINLRGNVVPVISLCKRFKREAREITDESESSLLTSVKTDRLFGG